MDFSARREALLAALIEREYARSRVSFLLGTDVHIEHEARVALTPDHVAQLGDDLRACGLEPTLYAVAGCGDRAGFADGEYVEAGARVVGEEETAALPRLDVVHALKEPTHYESLLPGPYLRIGALHLASKPPGLCDVLRQRCFAGILDGGTVGSCAYLKDGGDRTPIVGSMSRFAGSVSGKKVAEALQNRGLAPGKVVVVGGGIAGRAAIGQLTAVAAPLVVVETWEPTRRVLPAQLAVLGYSADDYRIVESLDDAVVDGAVGIVFAHRTGAKKAEKVCDLDQIRRMADGAAIADIAIDQGGSIAHPDYDEEDDAGTARRKYLELFGDDYFYYAETNMPREEPREASVHHGNASLPYVLALLALAGYHGDPRAVVQHLLKHPRRVYEDPRAVAELDVLRCLARDLRNGLQLASVDDQLRITDADIDHDGALAGWVRGCWDGD